MAENSVAGGNSLVADEGSPSATAGAGPLIGNIGTTVESISDGNWASGLLGGASAAASVGGFMADPLAGLAAAGVGWLIEHVEFLREPLDAVAGDQQAITAISQTWANVSKEVDDASADLTKAVEEDTARWDGDAAQAYRSAALNHGQLLGAVSMAAEGAGTMIDMCGIVLGVVRDIIRDLISQAVGDLIAAALEWAAAEAISLGTATPGMIADLTRRALKWAKKISEWTDKLTKVFKSAWSKLDELGGGVQQVKSALEKAFKAVTQGHAGDGIDKGFTSRHFVNEVGNKTEDKMKTYFAGELDSTYHSDENE